MGLEAWNMEILSIQQYRNLRQGLKLMTWEKKARHEQSLCVDHFVLTELCKCAQR